MIRRRSRTSVAARALAVVAAFALSAPAAAAAPARLSVPASVRSMQAAPIAALPVSGGVPFAEGDVRDPAALFVRDGDRRIPLQARVLSRWPDGSVRWLLADWQTQLGAGETRRVHIESGEPVPAAGQAVQVLRKPDRVVVDTGAAQFNLLLDGPVLLRTLDGDGRAAELSGHLIAEAQRHEFDGRRNIEVLDSGPWRARVQVRAAVGSFRQELRIDFFAGSAAIRVLHSIENHGRAAYVSIDDLALTLRLPHPASSCRFDLDRGSALQLDVREQGSVITQLDAARLSVDGKIREGRGAGSVACVTGKEHAAIASRYFWQEYPQGVRLARDALTFHLRAPTDRPMPFGSGAAKTHELWILARGDSASATTLPALARPAPLWVDPAWMEASGALRNALAPRPASEPFLLGLTASIERYFAAQAREEWDDSGRVRCSDDHANKRVGAYGMLNWGDWNFRGYRDTIKGCDAWGNLEYDTTQVLALAFAARGEPAVFDAMTAAARHFADVDRIHFSAQQPKWVGMNHPKNPLHFAFELGGVDLGHSWTEGLFSYGVMTGDDRALRAGREIADYMVRRRGAGMFRGNPRQWGWPQIALVAAWEYSGDERYREAATWFAHRGMFAHPADATGDWKRGILAEGLAYTHSVTTDATVLAWLETYAKGIAAAPPDDARYYPALAYVGRVKGEATWVEMAEAKVATLQFGRWGKPMTIAGRTGFATLAQRRSPSR